MQDNFYASSIGVLGGTLAFLNWESILLAGASALVAGFLGMVGKELFFILCSKVRKRDCREKK